MVLDSGKPNKFTQACFLTLFWVVFFWAVLLLIISYFYALDVLQPNRDRIHFRKDSHVSSNIVSSSSNNIMSDMIIKSIEWMTVEQIYELQSSGLNLRGIKCEFNRGRVSCFDDLTQTYCPESVNPMTLSLAKGQEEKCISNDQFYCTAYCSHSELAWRTHSISWCQKHKNSKLCQADPLCCPEQPSTFTFEQVIKVKDFDGSLVSKISPTQTPKPVFKEMSKEEKSKQKLPRAPEGQFKQDFNGQYDLSATDFEILKKHGFHLRGINCEYEFKDGKNVVQCFKKDNQARERCPSYVTPAYLSIGAGQYSCLPEQRDKTYCSVNCQEGTDEIKWSAFDRTWCSKHKDECDPYSDYIPIEEYETPEYDHSVSKLIQGYCTGGDGLDNRKDSNEIKEMIKLLQDLCVGVLARGSETKSLKDTLATWAKGGFLERVGETLIYLNEKNAEIEAIVQPYTLAPYNVKVMGNANNFDIALPITWLAGNSTKPYFLFMEKDFQLTENSDCVVEQLFHGIRYLKEGIADVVRLRSRRHPGLPNHADHMYRGHEDDCLTSRQPNLFCNVFHWIENPDQRWPKHFWDCDRNSKYKKKKKDAIFYCSDSYFCNWTNNPSLFKVSWWFAEYVNKSFKVKLSGNDPVVHLEGYMNWEPHAWNDRKWTVAQGEGLFTHRDRGKYGS